MARARTEARAADTAGAAAGSPVLLDRTGWSREPGEFPACVSSANAVTPLAFFLAWCAQRQHLSPAFEKRHAKALKGLRERKLDARELVLRHGVGELAEADLVADAQAFARAYLPQRYRQDFTRVLAADLPSPFHVEADWDSFDRLVPHIDRAFADGGRSPWWRRLLG